MEMSIQSIVGEAQYGYGALHQAGEVFPCLEFLMQKSLNGFLEIGSANGGSFHCWASVIPDGPKVSVDWNRGFGMSPNGMELPVATEENFETIQQRNSTWRSIFSDVHTIDGDSLESETVEKCREVLNGDLVDWLFIDATHYYEPALADFNNYRQFVRPGGYVGLHDVNSHDEMVTLWSDLKEKYVMVDEFLIGHGIGILQC